MHLSHPFIGRRTSLNEERIALLEKIHFQWDAMEVKWESQFYELVNFMAINGTGSLPTHRQNRFLRFWCNNQKKEYRKLMKGESTRLRGRRKEMLDKIGFPWPEDA